jgi:hypothetical protein
MREVKVSKKDLKTILGDELKQDIKAYGKVQSAKGVWNKDHWLYITVTFQKGEKKYTFDF